MTNKEIFELVEKLFPEFQLTDIQRNVFDAMLTIAKENGRTEGISFMDNLYRERAESLNSNVQISISDLKTIIMNAYKHGYSTYEMVEAGLEPYDAENYANWVMLKYQNNDKV